MLLKLNSSMEVTKANWTQVTLLALSSKVYRIESSPPTWKENVSSVIKLSSTEMRWRCAPLAQPLSPTNRPSTVKIKLRLASKSRRILARLSQLDQLWTLKVESTARTLQLSTAMISSKLSLRAPNSSRMQQLSWEQTPQAAVRDPLRWTRTPKDRTTTARCRAPATWTKTAFANM